MKQKLPFKVWEYEDQTKMKHKVFADYFDKWVKIVGKYYNLNYFDCYGGCGAYKDKDKNIYYGSPILAAQIAEKNGLNLKRKVKLVIIDNKRENIENIKKILTHLKLRVEPVFINDDFDKTINKILDSMDKLAPSFFFIDPFGYKIKITTLKRIMKRPRTEILLTFMFNAINRFLIHKPVRDTLIELFGCDDWKHFCHKKGQCREEAIVDLYRTKLKEFSRFVSYYRFSFPEKKRTYYYLFHITNHIKGCSVMKSCFAKYNFGRTEYRGKLSGQMTFFDYDSIKQQDIKNIILLILDKPKSYLKILEELIDETPYLKSNITKAIKDLEEKGKIYIKREPETTPTGRPRISLQNQDVIIKKEVECEKNKEEKSLVSERGGVC